MAFANVVAVPLAAFGALEQLGGLRAAAGAMAFSSVAVVFNALLLRRRVRAVEARPGVGYPQ
ncbi:MAG: hypothetical protein U0325_26755 [Polyangiales bacterium]